MEKEAAVELQSLSALGIVREASNILLRSSRSKLLWTLVLTLLLPLAFACLGSSFVFGPLLLKINEKQMEAVILHGETTGRELSSLWRGLLVVVATHIAFVFAMTMLSTAAGALSRVLSANVPSALKCLTSTFLWFFILSYSFLAACLLAVLLLLNLVLLTIFFPVVGGQANHKLKSGALNLLLFGVILVTMVVCCLQMYLSAVWFLASVVSALENKCYGVGAMGKSSDLMKGKRMTALALVILNIISGGVIGGLFGYAVLEGRSHGVEIAARAVYGTLLVGLLCFASVMGMLIQNVLYFVCKSYHHESIDDISSFHVNHLGDCEPQKTRSNQLEHLYADV